MNYRIEKTKNIGVYRILEPNGEPAGSTNSALHRVFKLSQLSNSIEQFKKLHPMFDDISFELDERGRICRVLGYSNNPETLELLYEVEDRVERPVELSSELQRLQHKLNELE